LEGGTLSVATLLKNETGENAVWSL
jgi:hypothetical protein